MAKLPTRESLGGLPAIPRRGITQVSPASGGVQAAAIRNAGVQRLAAGIDTIGRAADNIANYERQREEYETERRFQEFEHNQRKGVDESMRNVQPGQVDGFAGATTGNYVKGAKEFYKTVPDHLKGVYEDKLYKTERALHSAATTFARNEQKRVSLNQHEDDLGNIHQPQARVTASEDLDEKVLSPVEQKIKMMPGLTRIERDELARKSRRSIAAAHLDSLNKDQIGVLEQTRLSGGKLPGALKSLTEEDWGRAKSHAEARQIKQSAAIGESYESYLIKATTAQEFSDLSDRINQDPNLLQAHKNTLQRQAMAAEKARQAEEVRNLAVAEQNERLAAARKSKDVQAVAAEWSSRLVEAAAGRADLPDVQDIISEPGLDVGHRNTVLSQHQAVKEKLEAEGKRTAVGKAADVEAVFQRELQDAKVGRVGLLDRESIDENPDLSEQQKNRLRALWDHAAEGIQARRQYMEMFKVGAPINPYNKDQMTGVDSVFQQLGGDQAAFRAVVDKWGVPPPSVVSKWRGDLVSNDPARVEATLQAVRNLQVRNPNIFAGQPGEKDLVDAGTFVEKWGEDLKQPSKDVAKRWLLEQTSDYKDNVKARIKGEDIDKIVKDNLKLVDLQKHFDPSPWMPTGLPTIGVIKEQRDSMWRDYERLFRERYLERGDPDLAKKGALKMMPWGVSQVNGSNVVTRYPIEGAKVFHAPGAPQIENLSQKIADQAIADIKEKRGVTVTKDQLAIMPIPGITAPLWEAGQPPQYLIGWKKKDDPGAPFDWLPQRFAPDVKKMRAEQTAVGEAKAARALDIGLARDDPRHGLGPTGLPY